MHPPPQTGEATVIPLKAEIQVSKTIWLAQRKPAAARLVHAHQLEKKKPGGAWAWAWAWAYVGTLIFKKNAVGLGILAVRYEY